jgi:predicted phosphoribosyltransferase
MNQSFASANMKFRDRREAGRELAKLLSRYEKQPGLLVLGIASGGVPVAYEVAQALRAGFDVFVVRKLGVPRNPDLVMGAISAGGLRVLNREVVESLAISDAVIAEVTQVELKELARLESAFRDGQRPADVTARTVIVVSDAVETGATMRAALKALRLRGARRVIVATPVAALEAAAQLRVEADAFVATLAPGYFRRVGHWYKDFTPVTETEIRHLLVEGRNFGNPAGTLAPFTSTQPEPPAATPPAAPVAPRKRTPMRLALPVPQAKPPGVPPTKVPPPGATAGPFPAQ